MVPIHGASNKRVNILTPPALEGPPKGSTSDLVVTPRMDLVMETDDQYLSGKCYRLHRSAELNRMNV